MTDDVLAAYSRIAQDRGLAPMKRGSYRVQVSELCLDPDAVWTRVLELAPQEGWLLFQSGQMIFRSGLPSIPANWGLLLAAEATSAEGDSVCVNQDGSGGWRLVCIRHEPTGEWFCDEVQQLLLSGSKERRVLYYRRYWRHVPGVEKLSGRGFVQDRACFLGFK